MAGINLEALKALKQEQEDAKSGVKVFYASKIPGELNVRILPPTPAMNGLPFIRYYDYYLKGVGDVVSLSSFSEECPFETAVKEAANSTDAGLQKIAGNLRQRRQYLVPMLILDSEGEVDDSQSPCIMRCGEQLASAMNEIATDPQFLPDITDRVTGANLKLKKEGAGLNTKYSAMGWRKSTEMPESYYEPGAVPCAIEYLRNKARNAAYLKAVAEWFIFGSEKYSENSIKDLWKETPYVEREVRDNSAAEETQTQVQAQKPKKAAEPAAQEHAEVEVEPAPPSAPVEQSDDNLDDLEF